MFLYFKNIFNYIDFELDQDTKISLKTIKDSTLGELVDKKILKKLDFFDKNYENECKKLLLPIYEFISRSFRSFLCNTEISKALSSDEAEVIYKLELSRYDKEFLKLIIDKSGLLEKDIIGLDDITAIGKIKLLQNSFNNFIFEVTLPKNFEIKEKQYNENAKKILDAINDNVDAICNIFIEKIMKSIKNSYKTIKVKFK